MWYFCRCVHRFEIKWSLLTKYERWECVRKFRQVRKKRREAKYGITRQGNNWKKLKERKALDFYSDCSCTDLFFFRTTWYMYQTPTSIDCIHANQITYEWLCDCVCESENLVLVSSHELGNVSSRCLFKTNSRSFFMPYWWKSSDR